MNEFSISLFSMDKFLFHFLLAFIFISLHQRYRLCLFFKRKHKEFVQITALYIQNAVIFSTVMMQKNRKTNAKMIINNFAAPTSLHSPSFFIDSSTFSHSSLLSSPSLSHPYPLPSPFMRYISCRIPTKSIDSQHSYKKWHRVSYPNEVSTSCKEESRFIACYP